MATSGGQKGASGPPPATPHFPECVLAGDLAPAAAHPGAHRAAPGGVVPRTSRFERPSDRTRRARPGQARSTDRTVFEMHFPPRALALFVAVLLPRISLGAVASTPLAQLTAKADLVAIGVVTKVTTLDGHKVATLRLERRIAGTAKGPVRYLAEPRWTCDATEGEVGTRALFFLKAAPTAHRTSARATMEVLWHGRGMMKLVDIKGLTHALIWPEVRLPPLLRRQATDSESPGHRPLVAIPVSSVVAAVRAHRQAPIQTSPPTR